MATDVADDIDAGGLAAAATTVPRVLLVTGAYYPEISSAAVQCRDLARALGPRARFSVLTTTVDRSLPGRERIDGVDVHRLPVDVGSARSKAAAGWRLAATFARLQHRIDVVHVHGCSDKNIPLAVLSGVFGKPLVVSLHTAGQDSPDAVAARGRLSRWAFRQACLLVSVSPQLSDSVRASGRMVDALEEIPNGVNVERFHPATRAERAALRAELGLPADGTVVLFVGFFSRDKRPDVLFDAWKRVSLRSAGRLVLVCVGATRSPYYEVDASLADRMRTDARRAGLADRLVLIEPTHAIDKYFRSADVFVLPSAREAMPMALLEAMACGLPSVAFRLPRATDTVIAHDVNGWLVDEVSELDGALAVLAGDRARAERLGAAGRQTVLERFSIDATADRWLRAYQRVLGGRRS